MRCADLDQFFDGELADGEADAFRDHLGTCDRCQAKLLGRMQEELVTLPEAIPQVEPLAAPKVARARRMVLYIGPVLAAAAVLTVWLARPRPAPTSSSGLELAFEIERGGTKRSIIKRGSPAHLDDTLHLTVRGDRYHAIWVFLDEAPLAACPGSEGCKIEGDRMTLDLPIKARGAYALVAVGAPEPPGAPAKNLDAALAAVATAGGTYKVEEVSAD